MELRPIGKRGAIELSMTTVVVIVLSMLMLTLGLTLVRTIFTGATYNVERLNERAEAEINRLLVDGNSRSLIYLDRGSAQIKQGETSYVHFAIRNIGATGVFDYRARNTAKNCVRDNPDNLFVLPPSASGIRIADGESFSNKFTLRPAEGSELCDAEYFLEITKDGQPYDNQPFTIEVQAKGFF